MKEMPTAVLPADSEYVYLPDTDSWVVQKKSGNKILSKKDIEKVPPMQDPFAPYQDVEQRGPKEISEYDPEYQYLIKLVNAVVDAGVPVREIKTLSEAFPFDTVDDVSDLIGHIWDVAREKYHIPQDAVMKNLSKKKLKSSLNKNAYEGGWPGEEDSVTWGAAAPNTYSDESTINHDYPLGENEPEKEGPTRAEFIKHFVENAHPEHGHIADVSIKDRSITFQDGQKFSFDDLTNLLPKPDRGSDDPAVNDFSQNYFWGPNDLGRSHQNQPGANGWLPAGTEDMDGPSPNSRMSSFGLFMRKQSSLNKKAEILEISVNNGPLFPVIINPSASEAKGLFERSQERQLRYTYDEDGACYLWDAYYATHFEIKKELHEMGFPINEEAPDEFVMGERDLSVFGSLNKEASSNIQDINGIRVYRNPSPEQAVNLFRKAKDQALRYIATEYGDIYMWDAYFSDHSQMAEDIGLTDDPNWYDGAGTLITEDNTFRKAKAFNPSSLALQTASLHKQANPPSRFWIAPDGKEFPVARSHGTWIMQSSNLKILKSYKIQGGIQGKRGIDAIWNDMIRAGWTRVSNEPTGTGFVIEVNNIFDPPPYLDDFVAKYFTEGDKIQIGSPGASQYVEVTNPFPTLQKAIHKLQRKASLDEVLDQTTQDAIAAEYGIQYLIPLRFYSEARSYGQDPDRAFRYAMEEGKREKQEIDPKQLAELVETYF